MLLTEAITVHVDLRWIDLSTAKILPSIMVSQFDKNHLNKKKIKISDLNGIYLIQGKLSFYLPWDYRSVTIFYDISLQNEKDTNKPAMSQRETKSSLTGKIYKFGAFQDKLN